MWTPILVCLLREQYISHIYKDLVTYVSWKEGGGGKGEEEKKAQDWYTHLNHGVNPRFIW